MPLLGEDTANAITRSVNENVSPRWRKLFDNCAQGGRPNSSKLSLHFSSVSSCMHVREKVSSCWRPDSHAFRTKIPCHARKSHSWQQRTPFCSTMRSMNRFDAALCVACLAPVQDTNFKTVQDRAECNTPPTYTPRHWKLRQKNMRIHTLRSSSSCCFKDFSRRLTFEDSAQCS